MVEQFENDIFISYAHLDNQPLPFAKNPPLWVFGFYAEGVTRRATTLIGSRFQVFMV